MSDDGCCGDEGDRRDDTGGECVEGIYLIFSIKFLKRNSQNSIIIVSLIEFFSSERFLLW